jgi:hypothetical protein
MLFSLIMCVLNLYPDTCGVTRVCYVNENTCSSEFVYEGTSHGSIFTQSLFFTRVFLKTYLTEMMKLLICYDSTSNILPLVKKVI